MHNVSWEKRGYAAMARWLTIGLRSWEIVTNKACDVHDAWRRFARRASGESERETDRVSDAVNKDIGDDRQ